MNKFELKPEPLNYGAIKKRLEKMILLVEVLQKGREEAASIKEHLADPNTKPSDISFLEVQRTAKNGERVYLLTEYNNLAQTLPIEMKYERGYLAT